MVMIGYGWVSLERTSSPQPFLTEASLEKSPAPQLGCDWGE